MYFSTGYHGGSGVQGSGLRIAITEFADGAGLCCHYFKWLRSSRAAATRLRQHVGLVVPPPAPGHANWNSFFAFDRCGGNAWPPQQGPTENMYNAHQVRLASKPVNVAL